MPKLSVVKDNGQLLFDTDRITFGLIKSGNLALNRSDGVYTLRAANVDPNEKSSYNYLANKYPIYGFTVEGAVCPIVFLSGRGCLIGSARSGSTITFYYSSATSDTKYYCFDLMRDTPTSGPYLKSFLDNGVCTFNSMMPPLNINRAVGAPGPGEVWPGNGAYKTPYAGGSLVRISYGSSTAEPGASAGPSPNLACVVDVSLGAGEFAAYLPWSRTARIVDATAFGFTTSYVYGVVEGAFGRSGGMSFIFGVTTEGTLGQYMASPNYSPAMYFSVPVDRFPTALVIRTENLPFPYTLPT